MIDGLDPGALLARTYALPGGPRVTLRLARARDVTGIDALLRAQGGPHDELEAARLVNCDIGRRRVLCATALIGASEQVVGFGVIDLSDVGAIAPTTVVVDEQFADGLAPLLHDALVGHAGGLRRSRAA
ncbi:MAG: hypothetical protein WBQ18_01170 [Solirubrobacteraceae bacterium]